MKKFFFFIFFFFIYLYGENNLVINTSYYIPKEDLILSQIKKIKEFIPSNGENLGTNNKRCLIKLEIKNNSDKIEDRVFKFRTQYIDFITVYRSKNIEEKYGELNQYNKDIPSLGNEVFKVTIGAFEEKVLYIKLSSSSTIKTFLNNYSYEEYIAQVYFYKMLFTFIYGILFTMIIYNFFIWYTLKMKVYLYYVIYHFIFFIGILTWTGFGFEYIWSNYPIVNHYTFGIIANISYALHILFIITLIDTKKYLPKTTYILKLFAYIFFVLCFSSIFIKATIVYEFLSLISMLLLFGAMIYMFVVKKSKLALYAIISNLIIIFGNIFTVLSDLGLTDGSFIMDYFFAWGASIEVILMSFALSYKYKTIEKERNIAVAKQIEIEDMLINKYKLSTLGEMFNNIVHQWKQPLSQINSVVYSIESDFCNKKLTQDRLEDKLNSIELTTKYLSHTIDDFKNFSLNSNSFETFLIIDVIDEVLSILNYSLKFLDISIQTNCKYENLELYSNKNELAQVLMVILNNAKDAILESNRENKYIIINIYKLNESIFIEILNNGNKIPKEIEEKIFEPYFTTKNSNNGTGLGLYIAKLIIEERLNGDIFLTSDDTFTKFTIKINI